MKDNIKYIYIAIATSIIWITVASSPRMVDWTNYDKIWTYMMWVSGLVGMVIMTRQVVFGIRAIWGSWISDFFAVNNIHKWLWIWSFAAIIVHPIAVLIAYWSSFLFLFERSFANKYAIWITAWRIARQLIMVVFVTSVVVRKFLKYKIRHSLHLLTYAAILLVWLHGLFTGTMINWITAVYISWIFIGVVLFVATAYRLASQYWFGKIKSTIISNKSLNHDISELKLQLPYDIKYQAGQFMYIQIPSKSSHPFTIADYDSSTRIMTIAYKKVGEYTHMLSGIDSWNIYIDWPYGNFGQLDNAENVICLAGGIGITPFLSIADKYSQSENFKLLYLNQHFGDDIYYEKLSTKLKNKLIYIFSREKDESKFVYNTQWFVWHRFNEEIFDKIVPQSIQNKTTYLLCGSASMVKWMINILISKWISLQNIQYEPFDM